MGKGFESILENSTILKPQYEPKGFYYTYYTFSSKFEGEKYGISWKNFREKFIEFGGDGIYAASKLQHQEPAFRDNNIGYGDTPNAVLLQNKLMNFTTNQSSKKERDIQKEAMINTLKYFGDKFNVK